MSLSALRPMAKVSVHELLGDLGFDLSSWAISERGKLIENPAANGRAYGWSFEDSSSGQHVFMLWYEDMEESDGKITYLQDWRGVIAELDRTRPRTASRADSFLRHVSRLGVGAVVRVGVVEGSRAKTSDEESSRVARRVLDAEPWHISAWEPITSTYEFTRGLPETQTEDGSESKIGIDDTLLESLDQCERDIEEVIQGSNSPTVKARLISARLGQGKFRAEVLARWEGACAVTGSTTREAIRGSHCKPWRVGTDEERLDPANGLPLVATLDALFDVGLITFEDDGRIRVSSRLKDATLYLDDLKLRRALNADEVPYLAYHRQELFLE